LNGKSKVPNSNDLTELESI